MIKNDVHQALSKRAVFITFFLKAFFSRSFLKETIIIMTMNENKKRDIGKPKLVANSRGKL